MSVQKDIVYPMFLECCKYARDEYWKSIFEDLAFGVTPPGAYISKGNLCCSYKKKSFSYVIEEKDPKILYKEVYEHLSKKMGLISQKERLEKISAISRLTKEMRENRQESWSKIKKKNIREALIHMYVIRKQKEHNLTIKQARYLLSVIFIAMVFKIITAKEIIYNDGKVEDIEGIEFSDKKIILGKDIYGTETTFTPEIVIDQKIMSEQWEKYITNLDKISKKMNTKW